MNKNKAYWRERAKHAESEIERIQRNLDIVLDESMSASDIEMKIRSGELQMHWEGAAPGGVGNPGMRMLAAFALNVMYGREEERKEPPNYSTFFVDVAPAGDLLPVRIAVECVKPGGKSSHEIRAELEAELASLRDGLNEAVVAVREAQRSGR